MQNVFATVTPGALIAGLVIPIVISFFKRMFPSDDKTANFSITLIVCILGAAIVMVANNLIGATSFTLDNIWTTLATVIAISQAAYQYFWKPAGTTDKIEGK